MGNGVCCCCSKFVEEFEIAIDSLSEDTSFVTCTSWKGATAVDMISVLGECVSVNFIQLSELSNELDLSISSLEFDDRALT